MVYQIQFRQHTPDPKAYRKFHNTLDTSGFLHEITPGLLLVAPTCHIYHLREQLSDCITAQDTLVITPVTVNDYAEEDTRRFVDFWIAIPYRAPAASMRQWIAQLDA